MINPKKIPTKEKGFKDILINYSTKFLIKELNILFL